MSQSAFLALDRYNAETRLSTLSSLERGEFLATLPASAIANLRGALDLAQDPRMDTMINSQDRSLHQSLRRQASDMNDSTVSSSQDTTILQSIPNSQESNYTSASEHAITPPASDHSSATDSGRGRGDSVGGADKTNHLLHLSTIAAAQDKISLDSAAGARKRMADGDIKTPRGSTSPVKGHARNTSTVSVASTAGSTIGELSAELKTRLSYAMVKVNLGLQTRSIEEVESLASQAVSPTSSTSTAHRRQGSSASPAMAVAAASAQVHFAQDSTVQHPKSDSPPSNAFSNKPTLAPPATIQPSSSMPAPRSHPRRNSSPRFPPTFLHPQIASPRTPVYPVPLGVHQSLSQGTRMADPILFPAQTRNAREQDAVETLLFMSSPNNSANLKHTFSPSASPDPSQVSIKSTSARHALPSGPRKGLPTHRPTMVHKKFDKSPGMLHPSDSPMDLDSPQHSYYSPNRVTPRRRVRGNSTHLRGALSLPVGLGGGHNGARRVLRDEDIERMLDRVAAEAADSSDDDEIQIPRLKNGVAGVMGVRG
ncbi:hypothetical protein PT974_02244 [Cladobotryum mycophilum]|uniref:Uncharacterized protein n=1 Tax=Cladobotryum mycophilum TaxID=491253 RepID=A0ABR0SXM5_9HYPO